MILRAAGEVVRDHSSLAAEPEIEVTLAVGPSIQLPTSPHAIDYISLKMGSVAPYSSKEGRREKERWREREGEVLKLRNEISGEMSQNQAVKHKNYPKPRLQAARVL